MKKTIKNENFQEGAATLKEVEDKDIMAICKYADKRMYQDKSDWYERTGMERRVH